jgi:hypothetical protein
MTNMDKKMNISNVGTEYNGKIALIVVLGFADTYHVKVYRKPEFIRTR